MIHHSISIVLAVACALAASSALAAPEVKSVMMGVQQLRAAKGAELADAVKRVAAACRGSLRHEARDHPALLAELKRVAESGTSEEKRAIFDLDRCFTGPKLAPILGPRFADEDPKVAAYAAEVAARTEDPTMVPPLLSALAERKEACISGKVEAPEAERCVWLTYAPGAALGKADNELRTRAAEVAAEMMRSELPKVREVAVETAAASRKKAQAAEVRALIAKEKKGAFAKKNDAALLGRFAKRAKALELTGD